MFPSFVVQIFLEVYNPAPLTIFTGLLQKRSQHRLTVRNRSNRAELDQDRAAGPLVIRNGDMLALAVFSGQPPTAGSVPGSPAEEPPACVESDLFTNSGSIITCITVLNQVWSYLRLLFFK